MNHRFVGRPTGAEDNEATVLAANVHTLSTPEQRIEDVIFNIGYYEKLSVEREEPLDVTISQDVDFSKGDTTYAGIPLIERCLYRLGVQIKNTRAKQSTFTAAVKEDKTTRKLIDAYLTQKSYNEMFGGLEQRKLRAASTRDSVPTDTAANPNLEQMLKDRKRVADYAFGIEDVYADIITTDLRQIEELIFENEDAAMFEMFLRKELGDIKTTDITISESENKMMQVAIAIRWSSEFGENSVRMSAIDRWRLQVAIRARNALRNMGLWKIANDGSPATKTVTGGKTRANLYGIGFELGEAYPTNMVVMDVTTMKGWLAPSSTTNIVETIVDDDMGFRLLSFVAPNTDLGVTADNKWLAASNNKILNYVRELTLELYVKSTSFMTEVSYNADNKSYKASITFDFVPVFIDRNGRILWTIA